MTRVFVYEWCCGAARGDTPRAAPLCSEGWAMLDAAVTDFSRVAGVQVNTFLDACMRIEPTVAAAVEQWQNVTVTWVAGDEEAAFRLAAGESDFALVIAPDFDGILEARCRWAVTAGTTLLGPSPEAVTLTADKLALARHFNARGVPTPETIPARDDILSFAPPYVLKLRYGAGSQEMMVCTDSSTRMDINYEAAGIGEFILQPLIIGIPASVAFLIGPRRTHALPPAEQFVSVPGNFRYLGGRAPLPTRIAERAERVARTAIDAVPGLHGYVGVDVVLGKAGDMVIEINPRLTTSYVGLRALAEDNLMEVLLRLVQGESVRNPRWRSSSVVWSPDGHAQLVGEHVQE
jgi:predicted ATP-grasp superfamily ATP-dependent carboligase